MDGILSLWNLASDLVLISFNFNFNFELMNNWNHSPSLGLGKYWCCPTVSFPGGRGLSRSNILSPSLPYLPPGSSQSSSSHKGLHVVSSRPMCICFSCLCALSCLVGFSRAKSSFRDGHMTKAQPVRLIFFCWTSWISSLNKADIISLPVPVLSIFFGNRTPNS